MKITDQIVQPDEIYCNPEQTRFFLILTKPAGGVVQLQELKEILLSGNRPSVYLEIGEKIVGRRIRSAKQPDMDQIWTGAGTLFWYCNRGSRFIRRKLNKAQQARNHLEVTWDVWKLGIIPFDSGDPTVIYSLFQWEPGTLAFCPRRHRNIGEIVESDLVKGGLILFMGEDWGGVFEPSRYLPNLSLKA